MKRIHWRRLAAVLAITAMLIPFAAPGPALAGPYACSNNHTRSWTGRYPATDSNETGLVSWWIEPYAQDFTPCGAPGSSDGQPSAWIGFSEGAGNNGATGVPIFQAGVFKNYNMGWGETPHFFWAQAGCGNAVATPRDLGPTDWNGHKYRIDVYSTAYDVVIDDVIRVTVQRTDPLAADVACWLWGTKDLIIATEKYDWGDDFGAACCGNSGEFALMKRKISNTWFDLTAPTCDWIVTDPANPHKENCVTVNNGSSMQIWTQ